jgi:hypothetical protein
MSLPCFEPVTGGATHRPAAISGLYDQPILAIDPGIHTAMIQGTGVDVLGRWAANGSDDKTVRVWSLADGKLLRTIGAVSARIAGGTRDAANFAREWRLRDRHRAALTCPRRASTE